MFLPAIASSIPIGLVGDQAESYVPLRPPSGMEKVKSEDSESVLDNNTEGEEGREVKIPPPLKSKGAGGKCCATRPTFGNAC